MRRLLWVGWIALAACREPVEPDGAFPVPAIEWAPRQYACVRAATPPRIDGTPDEDAWTYAAWTEAFVDITGDPQRSPRLRTRAKMLWDDERLYIAAELEEPHVWGTITERDAVIFHDNDFEIFIDPDGDTHEYYEIEVNALGTIWDLMIPLPYRDGGHGVNAWEIRRLESAVHVDGTLNDPSDADRGWTVEMAIPFEPLSEALPRRGPPSPGDVWRVNFSRVEWRTEVGDGRTLKLRDPRSGEPVPEDNWSWSPQGLIAMHYPEMWGFVRFVTESPGELAAGPDSADLAGWQLRRVYYAQKRYHDRHGRYGATLSALNVDDLPGGLRLHATPNLWEAEWTLADGRTVRITQDGRSRIIGEESD